MNKQIEILKQLIESEKAELDEVMEEFIPLFERKNILEQNLQQYEEILARKMGEDDKSMEIYRDTRNIRIHPATVKVEGSQSDFVRGLIKNNIKKGEVFTIHTIQDLADEKVKGIELSRIVLHKVLKEKLEKQEIKQLEKGKGRTPSSYEKL